jgi:hypothetical protein
MVALIPAGLSVFQTLKSISSESKATEKERKTKEEFAKLKPNESILDYYNKAYNQYNPNPYQSLFYNQQMKNINRGAATALNAAQQRRGGLAAIPSITQGMNDASQKAAAGSEAMGAQALGRLGQAAGAKAAEENRIKGLQLGLLQQEAAAKAAQSRQEGANASNLLGQTAQIMYMAGKDNDYGMGDWSSIFGGKKKKTGDATTGTTTK